METQSARDWAGTLHIGSAGTLNSRIQSSLTLSAPSKIRKDQNPAISALKELIFGPFRIHHPNAIRLYLAFLQPSNRYKFQAVLILLRRRNPNLDLLHPMVGGNVSRYIPYTLSHQNLLAFQLSNCRDLAKMQEHQLGPC